MAFAQKHGSAIADAPASLPEQNRVANSPAQVIADRRAKLRALHAVVGTCVVRFADGSAAVVSADALRVIDIPLSHEALNA